MGNRAIIKADGSSAAVYLHWNGGRDSVEAFLTYCKLKGHRSPETDGYGWARLCQVIGNYFGGTLSIGIVSAEASGEYCDNGTYIIKNWEIVRREDFEGPEQNEYNLAEMLIDIDEAQPEKERIGEYLKTEEVKTSELKIGDEVVFLDWNGDMVKSTVAGIGTDRIVNGQNVLGLPYMNQYGTGDPADNVNNYIRTETARRVKAEQKKPAAESPVAVFINEELNGIELKFKTRPSDEIREALKENGFKWHHKKAVWYARRSPDKEAFAKAIAEAATA